MSRAIDKLPEAPLSKVKLVVASCSRTATLGLYQALKILGYRPYHMYELGMFGGDAHWEFFKQGIHARHNRFSGPHVQPRYTKKEFDKWFAGYDSVVEIPSYFGTDCLEAYMEDPDVKFILTERTPQSWAKSFNGFIGEIIAAVESPPLNILRHFNRTIEYFCKMNLDCYDLWADCTRPGDSNNEAALMRNYERYIRDVKRVIPLERLLVVKIEEGLGWEQICPFLAKDVPKGVEYPRGVEHNDFKTNFMKPLLINAMVKLASTVTTLVALGVGAWWKWFG